MLIECEGFRSLIKLVHRALHGKNTRTDKRDVDRIQSSVVSSTGSHRRASISALLALFPAGPPAPMTALDATSATLRLRGILMVACAAFCWSTGGLLQRLISADAWTTIFWRAVFAAVFLLAFVLWRDRGRGL